MMNGAITDCVYTVILLKYTPAHLHVPYFMHQYTYGPFVHSITTTYNIEEKNDIAHINK